MKGNILKSVTFTTDKNGKKIDETLLVAASRGKAVSVFVRDDATGKWSHSMHMDGDLGADGIGPGCRPLGRVAEPLPAIDHDGTVRAELAGEVKRFP